MNTVTINGYILDGADANYTPVGNVLTLNFTAGCGGEASYLRSLLLDEESRQSLNILAANDHEIINSVAEVTSFDIEYYSPNKISFSVTCECLPTYDRYGNKNGVQYYIESL